MFSQALHPSVLYDERNRTGYIKAVSSALFEVLIDNESSVCSVDDYVIVHVGSSAVFGKITNLVTSRVQSKDDGSILIKNIGTIKPSASIDIKTATIYNGVEKLPQIGAPVYKAPGIVVGAVLSPIRNSKEQVVLNFASFANTSSGDLFVTPEMMFGRHCSILGTTGSGKSWSCVSLVEECKKHKCKIVLCDPSGEYANLTGGVVSVYLGEDPSNPQNATEVALPYYDLKEVDLFAIFRPIGETQGPKLLAAIKSLKLAGLDPGVGVDGLVIKANKSKQRFDSAYKRYYREIENPYCDFDITQLTQQINNECIFSMRSDLEPFVWGDYNGMEQAHVVPLVNRINQIIASNELACIFQPEKRPSLFNVVDAFLNDSNARVLRISLQHLSYAFHTREIVANAIGRFLLEQARERRFEKHPLVVFLDEAHSFLDESLTEDNSDYPLDAFSLIAKEGRKFGLTICLATQRPSDIPEGVLSQMGCLLVHRVINHHDRAVIERAASQVDDSVLSVLPVLSAGEFVLLGSDFPMPLYLKMRPPKEKPLSFGPQFQQCWKNGVS